MPHLDDAQVLLTRQMLVVETALRVVLRNVIDRLLCSRPQGPTSLCFAGKIVQLQEIAMACVRLNDGAGPHWSCNQAIVQRAEEEADEEVEHWSDSDVSESELADAFREIQEVTNKMGLGRPHQQEKRPENAKKPATSMLVKPSRGPPILQLHVVMVIDASLSILVEHWFSRLNVVV